MEIIHSLENFKYKNDKIVVCIGNFDGVHLGHQQVIKTMLKESQKNSARGMVITFYPHPANVLPFMQRKGMITSIKHRLYLMDSMGVPKCFLINFNQIFADKEPEDFFYNILLRCMQVNTLVVGFNFAFGKNKKGNIDFLEIECKKNNINFIQVPSVKVDEMVVSSSLIRGYITQGKIERVSLFLGREYSIFGKVIHGTGRGRTLGFPTANVGFSDECIPPSGVYAVRVRLEGQFFVGVSNIGNRPTFGDNMFFLEVFLFDFSRDIYDQEMEVFFIEKIRDELVFSSVEALKAQIKQDCEKVKNKFNIN